MDMNLEDDLAYIMNPIAIISSLVGRFLIFSCSFHRSTNLHSPHLYQAKGAVIVTSILPCSSFTPVIVWITTTRHSHAQKQ